MWWLRRPLTKSSQSKFSSSAIGEKYHCQLAACRTIRRCQGCWKCTRTRQHRAISRLQKPQRLPHNRRCFTTLQNGCETRCRIVWNSLQSSVLKSWRACRAESHIEDKIILKASLCRPHEIRIESHGRDCASVRVPRVGPLRRQSKLLHCTRADSPWQPSLGPLANLQAEA